jgi:putative transposase
MEQFYDPQDIPYDSGAHTKHSNFYHIVWIPKYRKNILAGKVGTRCDQLIRQLCNTKDCEVDKLVVRPNHIHLLVKIPPKYAVSAIVAELKSKSAIQLFEEFPHLRQYLWKQQLWARGFHSNTVGGLNLDEVRDYIESEQIK